MYIIILKVYYYRLLYVNYMCVVYLFLGYHSQQLRRSARVPRPIVAGAHQGRLKTLLTRIDEITLSLPLKGEDGYHASGVLF